MDQFDTTSLMKWAIKSSGMTKVLVGLYQAIPEPAEDEKYLKQLIKDLRTAIHNYCSRYKEYQGS